jgi:Lrp/AsnC family transcriptional regulator
MGRTVDCGIHRLISHWIVLDKLPQTPQKFFAIIDAKALLGVIFILIFGVFRVNLSVPELDKYERQILALVQDNSSRSTAEIAAEIGLSEAPCWRRIQKLKREGFIKREVCLVDRAKIGLALQIFVQIKLDAVGRADISGFSDEIRKFPEVVECYLVMGNFDFLLKIVAKSMADYEAFFFERLSNVAGIKDANSIVAMSEVKSTTALPIE